MAYKCHNGDRSHKPVFVRDTPMSPPRGGEITTELPFRFSHRCNYSFSDLGKADKGCEGCIHREREDPRDPA